MEDSDKIPSLSDPREVCKHWRKKGHCVFGERCRFAHPLDLAPLEPSTPPKLLGKSNAETRKKNRGEGHRNRVRNASKCGFFRRFLIDTYGLDYLRSGSGVLDIAGGNGELSFELVNLSQIPSTVIDPRRLSLFRWQKRLRSGHYYSNEVFNAYNYRTKEEAASMEPSSPAHFTLLFKDYLWDRTLSMDQKKKIYETETEAASNLRWTTRGLVVAEEEKESVNEPSDSQSDLSECSYGDQGEEPVPVVPFEQVIQAIEDCSLIVGMHPDQAAGAIVDFALSKCIPFALVPCCTYAKQFPKRRLRSGEQVRSYEQLIEYLKEKDPSIKSIEMPFEGKNICIYKLKSSE